MTKSVWLLGVLVLISCSKKLSEGVVLEINKESIRSLSGSLCQNGEVLAEMIDPNSDDIYSVSREAVAFGFLNGTTACALTSDYHRDSISDNWFSIILHDNCLTNGSVWASKSKSYPDHKTILELIEFNKNPEDILRIQAGYDVMTKDLASAAGMKFYHCSPR